MGAVGGVLVSALLCFGVDILPGVTSFLRRAFIALEVIVVLIEFNSTVSTSNVLSDNKSKIVMSANTSATVFTHPFSWGCLLT